MSVADERNTLLDARDIARAIQRMAKQVVDFAGGTDRLVLVGIQRRGVDLARRLGTLIAGGEETVIPRGELDITLYRDDLQTIGPAPDSFRGRLTIRAWVMASAYSRRVSNWKPSASSTSSKAWS